MKTIPPKYRNSTVVRELGVNTWEQIFGAIGYKERPELNELSHDSIAQFLCTPQTVEDSLIDALEVVHHLGEGMGRQLLEQAADDAGINLEISDDEADRELAARVWISSRVKRELLKVLARAQAAFGSIQRSSNLKEFAGESSFNIIGIDEEKVKKMVSDWCSEHQKSSVVDIFVYNFDSIWCCDIVRGDPVKKVVEIKDGNQEELSYRPAVLDHIRVEPETGSIGILSRSSTFIPVYREVFGEVLTGNSEFFSGENICSLKPLQEKGKELFESDRPLDILRIDITELRWRRGDKDNFIVKGPDCFRILEDLGAQLTVGELIEAKMRFHIAGDNRPVRVQIKIPNKIAVNREEYEPVINRYLDTVGIRGRFDGEDTKNFWSLYPWHHPESLWRKHIGGDFDTLKEARCFQNVALQTVRHPDADNLSGVMAVESVAPNDVIAIGEDGLGLRTLTPSDYKGYKLDFPRVFNELNRKLELIGSPNQLAGDLWQLGYRVLSDTITIQVYFVTQKPSAETSLRIRQSLNGYRPVLIFPKSCLANTDFPVVHLDITGFYYEDLIGKIIESMQLKDEIDPALWSRADLILDCKRNSIWYQDVKIEGLGVTTHPFKFALLLAQTPGIPVKKEDINRNLSPSSQEDGIARTAKSDLLKKAKKSLEASGHSELAESFKNIVRRHRGGYSINCAVEIIN